KMEIIETNPQYQYVRYGDAQAEATAPAPPSYGASDDVEGRPKNLSFDNQSIRHGFIRKVYLILMAQLMVTFGAVAIFAFSPNAKMFAFHNTWLFWLAVLIMLVTLLCMICLENVRRQTPTNFIFLAIFTFAQSFLIGVSTSRYAGQEVLLAIGITVVICLSLTLFAMQTKYDFTTMGGILVSCLVCLLILGLFSIFFGGKLSSLIYSSLGALLFSFYLIYDTQLMMGGNHKYAISPEEYIFATLNLYLDILNIFMDVLNVLGITQ
ncbi:hypothetical protein KR044_003119, partial [Drosophila immigrans]